MTESEFEAYYLQWYRPVLKYALTRTNDFFLAEEAVNDALGKAYRSAEPPPYSWLKNWVFQAVIDGYRSTHPGANAKEGPLQIELMLDRPAHQEGYTTLGDLMASDYVLEEVVMDLLTIKEALAVSNPSLTAAVFNPVLPPAIRKARLHRLRVALTNASLTDE